MFGGIQLVDSTHSIADVNTGKEQQREKEGKGPIDPDAKWGAKGKAKPGSSADGGSKPVKYFYGYKAHVSLNAENHLITSVIVTPGNAFDGHYLQGLIQQDLAQNIPVNTVAADRGYDDSENHYWLEQQGLQSAICLHGYRTQKKDGHKEIWLELKADKRYRQGVQERHKIEQKFEESKQRHGFARCRYRGQERYGIQVVLTVIVLNLKRMVKLLYELDALNPPPAYCFG